MKTNPARNLFHLCDEKNSWEMISTDHHSLWGKPTYIYWILMHLVWTLISESKTLQLCAYLQTWRRWDARANHPEWVATTSNTMSHIPVRIPAAWSWCLRGDRSSMHNTSSTLKMVKMTAMCSAMKSSKVTTMHDCFRYDHKRTQQDHLEKHFTKPVNVPFNNECTTVACLLCVTACEGTSGV